MSDTATEVEKKSGVLRMLTYAEHNGRLGTLAFLGWQDAPPDATHGCIGGDVMDGDTDLGDYECIALPTMPTSNGLWLLTWPWREVRYPDDPSAFTAAYNAKKLRWTRPTVDELTAMGALP